MEIEVRSVGVLSNKIVELKIKGQDFSVIEDVSSSDGFVDADFIENLRQVANELENANQDLAMRINA